MNSLVISTPWGSFGGIVFDLTIDAATCHSATVATFIVSGVSGAAEEIAVIAPVPEAHFTRWEPITESHLSLWSHVASAQRQKTVFIRDLADARVSVAEAIPVALEFWDNLVTACCHDLEEFEVAGDEFTALEQLKASIVDLYFLLKSEQKDLGPLPLRQWNYLRRMVREI